MQKEKLRSARKRKGYTQQQVADIIATDVSNYCRKESGDVKIFKDEWEKIAGFLEVSVDEIYEAEEAKIFVENNVFNESPGSYAAGNVTNFGSDISISVIKNLQDYIALLKEENDKLKQQIGSGK